MTLPNGGYSTYDISLLHYLDHICLQTPLSHIRLDNFRSHDDMPLRWYSYRRFGYILDQTSS